MLETLLVALATAAAPASPPVVSVDAARRIGGASVPARMRAPGFEGRIAIGVRGRWSRRFPKRSYGLELRDRTGGNRNEPLLGMPSDDDWVLYAAYNDRTLMRNVLAYDTSRWMGRYAARTRFVRLRLNGRHHGVYVLMEKLKLLDERVAGDFLLERTSVRQSRTKDPSFRTPVTRLPVVWADPEREDLEPRQARRARRAVERAERALYRGRPGAWRPHLHGPAAVDHVLLNELFKNQDGMRTSAFMTTTRGGPVRLGPIWDFDHSMGNSTRGPSAVLPGWMLAQRPWAQRQMRARERRLAPAARRDSRRWPAGEHRPRGRRDQHVRELRRWLVARIDWLDSNVHRLGRG